MLRSAQQHHVMLSSMADQKASFLIGASVVTLSIVLGHWRDGNTVLPLVTLGLGSLLSATFAALALMPRGSRNQKDSLISFNPLFFGHFYEMAEADYVETMNRVIQSDKTVYEALVRDIYQMGQVLRRKKFYYLGLGYRCFVVTLVATFLTAIFEAFR